MEDDAKRARTYLLEVSNDDGHISIAEGSYAHKRLTKLLGEVREEGREDAKTRWDTLADAVKAYIHRYNLIHEEGCPEDDTCDCELVQTIEKALH